MTRIFLHNICVVLAGVGLLALPVASMAPAAQAQTYNDYETKPPYIRKPPTNGRPDRSSRSRGNASGAAIGFGVGLGLSIIDGISRQNRMQPPPEDYYPPEPPPRQGYRPAPRRASSATRPPRLPRATARIELPDSLRTAKAKPRVYSIGDKPWASDTEFVVLLHPGLARDEADLFIADYGLELVEAKRVALLDQLILKLKYPADMSPRDILEMATDGRVFRAQPDYYYYPSDNGQSEAATPFAELQYALDRLGLGQLRDEANGEGIKLAVIDSGIREDHPSLSGVVSARFSAFDGRDETVLVPEHGTAVASIIAARSGMRGIAQGVSLLSAEVFHANAAGHMVADSFDIVHGIDWAVGEGARILNLSFAGGRDDLLEMALSKASEKGIVLVAAAGNEGSDAPVAYPAAYGPVIAVTATDVADALYVFANQGDDIELAAPGVDVLVAAGADGFALQSGTSMATAYISGAVALLLQKQPDLALAQIKQRLSAAALDLGAEGKDPQFGYGRLDVSQVLAEQGMPEPSESSEQPERSVQIEQPEQAETAAGQASSTVAEEQ
ncbi:S8 family serine peptidase [uncultured Cohaesibacter sp.]|uniref:S8 family peptidase n=1 Tax=uncultured Cohaesibacter sp. TaxID=1002546 RepID=UPI0029C85563|nr:S8 family serine peptidase [uncultured Cohaesibacter sp.]